MVATPPNGPQGQGDAERGRSRFFGRRSALKSPNEALQPEAAPPPPAPSAPPKRKRRSGLSGISSLLTFLLVLVFVAGYALVAGERKLKAPGPLQADKVVVIPPRTDVPEIIAKLESEGVIDDYWLMQGVLTAEGSRPKLKAGEYLFKQNASLREVIDVLVAGRSILHEFTIPEGWTSEMIVGKLREQELLENEIKDMPKEGSLMPNTYKFARGESRDKQIQRMADAQKKALAEIWARRAPDLPLKSPFELVTLASIVEKETGRADERPRVAGVFVNRLVKGMKLQSDPTIVYGLVGGKGSLGHPITRDELQKQSPYNTYQIPGLPPGPIANPGRAAMEAVANPSRTQEIFFVADGTGGHVFAETLDQHNRNVQRWRQIEKDAKDRLAPDADKSIAPAPAPAKPGEQRGDLGIGAPAGVFGALPAAAFAATGETLGPAAEAARRLAAADSAMAPVAAVPLAKAGAPAAPSIFTLGPGLDELGIKVRGVDDARAAFSIDGTPTDDLNGVVADMEMVPVSATRRADQKARAAKFGIGVPLDAPLPAAPPPLAQAAVAPPDLPRPARARVVDASEGKAIDPLRNRSFDLTSSKTVPSFR